MSVVKIIEISSESPKSIEDGILNVITLASKPYMASNLLG